MKKLTIRLLVTLLLLLLAVPATAHKVRIFAYGEGNKIVGETEFSGGRRPQNAEVLVKDLASGKLLTTVRTDANGNFSLPIPAAARKGHLNLMLILKAGEGHQGKWQLNAEDYLDDYTPDEVVADETLADRQPATDQAPAPKTAAEQTAAGQNHPAIVSPAITPAALKKIVEEAVDRKIAPLKRLLLENQDRGPSLQEIMGGIGYLIGLAGIVAYFKSRKK